MRNWTLLFLVVAALFPGSRAVGSIEDGRAYLLDNQNLDGTFGKIPWRDTEWAVRALLATGGMPAGTLVRVESALLSYDDQNVDLTARVARGLALLDDTPGDLVSFLMEARNADGTWGFQAGWPGAVCETAQVLLTLADAGDANLAQVQEALSFLVTQQHDDGAFGWLPNGEGTDPFLALEALRAMVAWQGVFDLENEIGRTTDYLVGLQRADGLLETTEPVLATALAVATTVDLDVASAFWTSALEAVRSAQWQNGSWEDDPYTTAAALMALTAAAPDLAVTAVEPAVTPVVAGEANGVVVVLSNVGRVALSEAVRVEATFTDVRTGVSTEVGSTVLSSLASGGAETVSIPWDATGQEGDGYLEVLVDPEGASGDSDLTNNRRVVAVTVLGGPDLAVRAADAVFVPAHPVPGETVSFSSLVRSYASIDLDGVEVTLHDGDPMTGALLYSWTVALAAGETVEVEWSGPLAAGSHALYLTVDPANEVLEENEANNQAVTTVTVTPDIDLAVASDLVQVHPAAVGTGETATVTAVVVNRGRTESGSFDVGIYLEDGTGNSTRLATVGVDGLESGVRVEVGCEVAASGLASGAYRLRVVADDGGVVEESDESNNEGSVGFQVLEEPNLALGDGDFDPAGSVRMGDETVLRVQVHNTGGSTIRDVPVAFFLDTTDGGAVGSTSIFQISAGGSAVSPGVTWDTTGVSPGDHTLIAVVDPENVIAEEDETDNLVQGVVTVQPLPDLLFSSPLEAEPSSVSQGQAVNLTATIENGSDGDIATPFVVAFYLGDAGAGGRQVGSVTVDGLAGHASQVVSTSWDSTGSPGDHLFQVVVDASAVVDEADETNNSSSGSVSVQTDDPDLIPVTDLAASVAGDNVTLSWNPSASPDGYRVYLDGASINPADTESDLVPPATVAASSASAGHEAAQAADGDTTTYWSGDAGDDFWTYEVDFGEEREVAGYRMWLYSAGNLSLSWAFQTWHAGTWVTRDSARVSTNSTGAMDSGIKTLPEPVSSSRVRFYTRRYTSGTDPAAFAEVVVYPTGLVTGTSLEHVNAPGGTHVYEVRAASITGLEGEGAQVQVALGSAEPATDPVATAYPDRTEVSFTPSTSPDVDGYQLIRDGFLPVVDTADVTGLSGAASSSAGYYYGPSSALDGNTWTYWLSSYGDRNWWFEVRFPRPLRVYGMTITWNGYYGIDYDIESWTGSEWILEEAVRGEQYQVRGFAFPQVAETDAVRIRIYRSSNSNYVTITEISVEEAVPVQSSPITDDNRSTLPVNYRLAALTSDYSFYSRGDIPVEAADEAPPPPPSDVAVTGYTRSDISLGWSAVSSAEVAGYRIYDADGTILTDALVTDTSWTAVDAIDRDLLTYVYCVSAVDTLGTEGDPACVTWTPPLPAAVTATGTGLAASVQIEWSPPDEPLREVYRVFRDGEPVAEVAEPPFIDETVGIQTYTYQVAGVDIFSRVGPLSDPVSVTPVLVDLSVADDSILVSPGEPTLQDTVQVSALVQNLGSQASSPALVAFHDGDPEAGGPIIGTVSIDAIPPFSSRSAQVAWPVSSAGIHALHVVVDPDDQVEEADEQNNQASLQVTVEDGVAWSMTLAAVDASAFPLVSATLTVADEDGVPVDNLPSRTVTLTENALPVSTLEITPTGEPGTHRIAWETPNPTRDGTSRTVTATLDLPGVTGVAEGGYTAPSDPRMDMAALALTSSPEAPLAGEAFQVLGDIRNAGSVDVTGFPIAVFSEENGALTEVARGAIDLAAGEEVTVSVTLRARPGTTTYHLVLDPDHQVVEADEQNNEQTLPLHVPESPLPDIVLVPESVAATPGSPVSGDPVALSTRVLNAGAAAADVVIQGYRDDGAGGLEPFGAPVTLPTLTAESDTTVVLEWDTTGLEGDQVLYLWADPLDQVLESDETNNLVGLTLYVESPPATLSLETDRTTYGANEVATISARVEPSVDAFTGTLVLELGSETGEVLEALEPIAVGPLGGARTFSAQVDIGTRRAGAYLVQGRLLEDEVIRSTAEAGFVVEPAPSLSAEVSLDRSSHDPGDIVTVGGEIVNTSVNTALSGVTGTLTLIGPSGETWGEPAVLESRNLEQGGAVSLAAAWSIAGGDPGTWRVTLEAAAGATTAEDEATFVVTSTADTGLGIAGSVDVDPGQVVPGGAARAAYLIENHGNDDVVGADARLLLVGGEDGETYDEVTFVVDVARGESAGSEVALETALPEGAYVVLLQVRVGASYETLSLATLTLLSVAGSITIDPVVAEGGEDDVTLRCNVSNLSDVRLDDLQLQVVVSAVSDGATISEQSWVVSLEPGAEETNDWGLDGTLFRLGTYQVTLFLAPTGGTRTRLADGTFEVVDTRPPVTSLTFDGVAVDHDGTTYVTGATRLVLSSQDSFSGVATVQYALDGVEHDYMFPFSLPEEGPVTVAYHATDTAGNVESPKLTNLVRDDSPPDIRVEGVSDGQCGADPVSIQVQVDDDSPTVVSMTLDGAPYTGTTVSDLGDHTLEVTAVDLLEHSTVVTVEFVIVADTCACPNGDGCPTPVLDVDGDGHAAGDGDCDDLDPLVYPGADERCNGIDDDCDGEVDETPECTATPAPTATPVIDSDGDGWAALSDCDDGNPDIHPGALEVCDSVDNDCDGAVDEDGGCASPTPTSTPSPSPAPPTPSPAEPTPPSGTPTPAATTTTPTPPASTPGPTPSPTSPLATATPTTPELEWTATPAALTPSPTEPPGESPEPSPQTDQALPPSIPGCTCTTVGDPEAPTGLVALATLAVGWLRRRRTRLQDARQTRSSR